jgi:hypothetical protein
VLHGPEATNDQRATARSDRMLVAGPQRPELLSPRRDNLAGLHLAASSPTPDALRWYRAEAQTGRRRATRMIPTAGVTNPDGYCTTVCCIAQSAAAARVDTLILP